jgi:hypothetical protein
MDAVDAKDVGSTTLLVATTPAAATPPCAAGARPPGTAAATVAATCCIAAPANSSGPVCSRGCCGGCCRGVCCGALLLLLLLLLLPIPLPLLTLLLPLLVTVVVTAATGGSTLCAGHKRLLTIQQQTCAGGYLTHQPRVGGVGLLHDAGAGRNTHVGNLQRVSVAQSAQQEQVGHDTHVHVMYM